MSQQTTRNKGNPLFRALPGVDRILKAPEVLHFCRDYPERLIAKAVRLIIEDKRKEITAGLPSGDLSIAALLPLIKERLLSLTTFSLTEAINATGVVVHTNLGRAPLSEGAIEHALRISRGYSNLEYDLGQGKRGKRSAHVRELIKELTGVQDAIVVNNNAAAVLLCLSALAKDRQVPVSRGELVEIGGSFRIPDIMALSGAQLKEVGTTNKTRLKDYEEALCEETALILKVHRSNYRITGFTDEVDVEKLVDLAHSRGLPVMYDLGSGFLIDPAPLGIRDEPVAVRVATQGVDVITFSGDKLLGGPQAGIIAGKSVLIGKIAAHPLARAVRVDKLTLAALEATLWEYMDTDTVLSRVPVLRMLFQDVEEIRKRARRLATLLPKKYTSLTGSKAIPAEIKVLPDSSQAGGGSLPDRDFPTWVVSLHPAQISVNGLEQSLRKARPPVIVRIYRERILVDMRTVHDREVDILATTLANALAQTKEENLC